MMKKSILFGVLIFTFLFLSPVSVNAIADCPVCPSGYFWNMNYRACQEGPAGIPNPRYVDPIYVDCRNCQCNPGEGCQSPCTYPPHPGLYTCHWSGVAGECLPVSQCTANTRPGDECASFKTYQECVNAGPFVCLATTTPQPGISCNICGCQNGAKTTTCPNCNTECYSCVYINKNSWTAIGCIPTSEPQTFVTWLLARAIGVAGGIAFLLMIFAGFQIITSAGDPKRLQAGKEMLTSAIIGLIVIIFSIFLLKVIGYDILRLPGFELLK